MDFGEGCGEGKQGSRGRGNEEVYLGLGAGSGAGGLWGAKPIRLGGWGQVGKMGILGGFVGQPGKRRDCGGGGAAETGQWGHVLSTGRRTGGSWTEGWGSGAVG